jgi:OHCU decarboxylase
VNGIERLNGLDQEACDAALRRCCGSGAWVRVMRASRPFSDRGALVRTADEVWLSLGRSDWLEAFAAHPRIGERHATGWSADEQAGTRDAAAATLERLAEAQREYEQRFGHLFIVCATGRRANEMLAIVESRLGNAPDAEMQIAVEEQRKIMRLRLDKLLDDLGTMGEP